MRPEVVVPALVRVPVAVRAGTDWSQSDRRGLAASYFALRRLRLAVGRRVRGPSPGRSSTWRSPPRTPQESANLASHVLAVADSSCSLLPSPPPSPPSAWTRPARGRGVLAREAKTSSARPESTQRQSPERSAAAGTRTARCPGPQPLPSLPCDSTSHDAHHEHGGNNQLVDQISKHPASSAEQDAPIPQPALQMLPQTDLQTRKLSNLVARDSHSLRYPCHVAGRRAPHAHCLPRRD